MTPGNPKSLRILLVDDFELVRVMLRNTLRDLGFTNILEAVNKLTRDQARVFQKFKMEFS